MNIRAFINGYHPCGSQSKVECLNSEKYVAIMLLIFSHDVALILTE